MVAPKPVVLERNGEVAGIFASIISAARCIGITEKGMRARIANASKMHEGTYRYATDEEAKLIRTLVPEPSKELNYDLIKYAEKMSDPNKRVKLKELEKDEDEDLSALSEKYNIVPYELSAGCVCVTPCPYRDYPKPKVGSALCVSCPSFYARNRKTKQVACTSGNVKTKIKRL